MTPKNNSIELLNNYLRVLCAILIFITTVLSINTSYAITLATYSLDSDTVKNLLPKIGKSRLVLISIDDTIIKPKSKMFNYGSAYRGFIEELSSAANHNVPGANRAIAQLILQRQVVLVEEGWPNFINKLKMTGALVLGFARVNPACQQIDNFEERQYQQLGNLGIKFTTKINNQEVFSFDEINNNSPIFYHGIIFTSTMNKDEALARFLHVINIPFNNIIFFSNKKSEIKDIDNLLRAVDSYYYGVEYLAITDMKELSSPQLMQFQQQRLLQTGEWLEDEEAQKIMKSKD